MVSNRILDSRQLSLGAKMVYSAIRRFCYETDITWASQELQRHILQVSDNTLRKYLKELHEKQLVTWECKGHKRNNYYLLLPPSLWQLEEEGFVLTEWGKRHKEDDLDE